MSKSWATAAPEDDRELTEAPEGKFARSEGSKLGAACGDDVGVNHLDCSRSLVRESTLDAD